MSISFTFVFRVFFFYRNIRDGEMWTLEQFMEKNEEACRYISIAYRLRNSKKIKQSLIILLLHRLAALELNRKSQMVSEAVEEVLELVQNAAITFRLIIGAENDVLAQGEQ